MTIQIDKLTGENGNLLKENSQLSEQVAAMRSNNEEALQIKAQFQQ